MGSDGARGEEMEPPVVSCRCHFFDGCGDLPPLPGSGGGEHWVDEVLRRRFLRLGMASIVSDVLVFFEFCVGFHYNLTLLF